MRRGRTPPMCCAVAAALMLAGPPALASKADNTVHFAYATSPPSIDAYYNNVSSGTVIADQIWDTLVFFDPDTRTYQGNLATSWKWVSDKSIELELRQGVKFHNGAPFDADDVAYTFNFVTNPANKATALGSIRWIDHVEKIDRYKVRIVTRKPFPAAIAYLAYPSLAIYPHTYYAAVGPKGMNERPVGTGPYRVAEHVPGKYIRLERVPGRFKGSPKPPPKIDKIEIRFIPDPQTRVAEVVAGGVDLIANVVRDQADQLRSVANLRVGSSDSLGRSFLQLNTMPNTPAPQLLDVRVREAIMYAIDRNAIAKFITGENARVLQTECHPVQFGCSDDGVRTYGYDPGKAKRLLAEAGYSNGFDVDLYAFNYRNRAEAILGYLRAVGIRARLRYLATEAVVSATRAGKAPMVLIGSANAIADSSFAVSRFHEFSPEDLNRDPEIRDLLQTADSSLDPAVRKASYSKAFKLIAERAYVLPLTSEPFYYVAARDLSFTPRADGILRFYEMSWK